MTGCWNVSVTGIELVRGQEVKKLEEYTYLTAEKSNLSKNII